MGIIDKLITGPLWRIIESFKSILELNPFLLRLKIKLSNLCKDASSLLSGENIFDMDNAVIHDDEVFKKLFEDTKNDDFDVLTQQCLEVICHALVLILERQCVDLPGGKYWNASTTVKESSTIVPTTNKASESDFAILDLLVRTKPNASIQTIQALTMWSRNQRLTWFDAKSDREKIKLMQQARTQVTKMKEKYNIRKADLKEQKRLNLLKKQEEKRKAEEKTSLKKADAVNNLVSLGLQAWITIEQAESSISNVPETARCETILAQLEFYRHVMSVKCNMKLYNKTKVVGGHRQNLKWGELFENLKLIMKISSLPAGHQLKSTNTKSKDERDKLVEKQKKEMMSRIKDARIRKLTAQQKSEKFTMFAEVPEKLIGYFIQHRVKEEDEEEVFWCRGKVLSIDKHNKKTPKRTLYNVSYDNEEEKVWSFPLLLDFEKGDVILL